ncbi:MAG: tetratricopeptide repeat protein [Candidatus Obscuribacterales bacterium]|nr:tetratricopeptide repeat protein [Candidatus Obscuribacterales bacterium]
MRSLVSACLALVLLGLPASANPESDIDRLLQSAAAANGAANYSEAESFYKQALSNSVERLGAMSPYAGKVALNLGEFYMNNGRYGDAEHFMQRALIVASGYNSAVASSDGEFRNVKIYLSNITKDPNMLPGSVEVADCLSSLANLYTKQERYTDAERFLRRIIQIYGDGGGEKAGSLLSYTPNSSQMLAEHQRSLALVLSKQGNATEAESVFKTYVATVRKAKGNSPELQDALRHLSAFYQGQNRSAEAEAAEQEAKDLSP